MKTKGLRLRIWDPWQRPPGLTLTCVSRIEYSSGGNVVSDTKPACLSA